MAAPTSPPANSLTNRLGPGAISAPGPLLGGVASRLALELGVTPLVLRVSLVILTMCAGWGILIYGLGWWLLRERSDPRPIPITLRHNVGIVAATTAQVLLLSEYVNAVQVGIIVPLMLVAFALALTSSSAPGLADGSPTSAIGGGRRGDTGRIASGIVLMVLGLGAALGTTVSLSLLLRTGTAAVVLVFGVGLIVAPWIRQVINDAETASRQQAAAEARADMAAHLHDSVLQTLTLIQNRAEEPDVTAALAHRQERELRRWLYIDGDDHDPTITFRGSLEQAAAEVEDQYLKVIDCIVVGDLTMGIEQHAVVAAAKEAMVNAAKFAGIGHISVFGEADSSGRVQVFVRDRGIGFDLANVSTDRLGIARSIRDRVERVGGSADVQSAPGHGTEVHLQWSP